MFSRNISSERQANLALVDRKRSASAGASSQKTRSSKDGKSIKTGATKPRISCEQRLLSRKESKKVRDDAKHKGRLYNETCVANADNNDPIYILRKEIQDWRLSGQLANGFERDQRAAEDETEKSSVQGIKKKQLIVIISINGALMTRNKKLKRIIAMIYSTVKFWQIFSSRSFRK